MVGATWSEADNRDKERNTGESKVNARVNFRLPRTDNAKLAHVEESKKCSCDNGDV